MGCQHDWVEIHINLQGEELAFTPRPGSGYTTDWWNLKPQCSRNQGSLDIGLSYPVLVIREP